MLQFQRALILLVYIAISGNPKARGGASICRVADRPPKLLLLLSY